MDINKLAVNTIKVLSAEMIQKANSGHPGLPLGASPAAFALWANELNHNPRNPKWANRDRFILSAGHGSALLYSLLHLFGYGLTIDDLKNFRQFGSKTPGHPENFETPGVEVSTGPLGQGIANAVGMALAETVVADKFNRDGYKIVDHYTYALCGDGCLMEGIASEAASFAGHFGLSKLIVLYDSNDITIEGSTDLTFSESVRDRFKAFGWAVSLVEDGNDMDSVLKAIESAKAVSDKPSLIEIKTIIGDGAPNKAGKSSAHGEPLGVAEIGLMKENIGWKYDGEFFVPDEVREYMAEICKKLDSKEQLWNKMFDEYKKEHSDLYLEWQKWHSAEPIDLSEIEEIWQNEGDLATRASSEIVFNKIIKHIPNMIGGSADLEPSNKSTMKDIPFYSRENRGGTNIHYGIREHAMTAMANGIALHGGLRAYIAGFFVFIDYMKGAMRLSALMGLPIINILTHDSIGVGEDGPTHQPIEHLASLRSIPNFTVIRPCDSNEVAAAWCLAFNRTNAPTALILSRQNLPLLKGTGKDALKGGYVLRDCDGGELPDIILMASGSEVSLIVQAYEALKEKGVKARVVSMPSFEVFEEQTDEYKESVLPKNIRKRLAVEAGTSFGWHKYIGLDGDIISIDEFGFSAPGDVLFKHFGFTVENVVEKALDII
jgi:transketolase